MTLSLFRSIGSSLDLFCRSQEQTCSSVAREYKDKYANVVDSLDEQSGE